MYQSDRLSRNSYSSEMYKPQSKRSECRRCHSSSFEIFEPASRPNSSASGISHRPFSNSSEDDDDDEHHTMRTNDEQLEGGVTDFPREVVRMPTPPPIVKRIVERVPTPEAYVIERVIVRPAPRRIVERIIERPRTPPPRVVHKEITEPPPPPIVRTRVVKVDSWSKNAVDYYYEQPSYPVIHESISHSYSRSGSPYSNYDTYNACPVGTKCESMNKKFPCYMHNQQIPMTSAHPQISVPANNGYFDQGNVVNPPMAVNYPHNIISHHNQSNYPHQHPAYHGHPHNMPSSVAYYQGNHVTGQMPMIDYQHPVPAAYDMNGVATNQGDHMYIPTGPAVSWQGQQQVPYVYGYQHVPGGEIYHFSQQVY